MEKLNESVSETYCDICACNIKNKEKHIKTKKHQKELKSTHKAFTDAVFLKQLFSDFDINNSEQVNNTIDILKGMM